MSIQDIIKQKLINNFMPAYVDVINESYKHKGHSGDDGSGESHFKIRISGSKTLAGLGRLEQHRKVNAVLLDEYKIIHALEIEILE